MRFVTFCVVGLSACFGIPTYQDGILECDNRQCPPDMECRADNRCYRIGAGPDAPNGTADAPPNDGPTFDAPLCTTGEHRCAAGNLEVCQTGVWTPALPTCADQSMQCFDPAPAEGTDAYCGTCLKGAQRCTATSPSTRQTCPVGTGIWSDAETCDATLGCFDLDGPDGPQAYCGVCKDGDKQCNGGLQTCAMGQWSTPEDCATTSGWSCFDPAPPGGTDAYCGLCLKNSIVCHGDNRDQCNAQGTAFDNLTTCASGCNPSTSDCCAAPTCGGRICGNSPPNACGRTITCGSGCVGPCCNGGTQCCTGGQVCCGGTQCCGPISQCNGGTCG
jgi:hypothetical protein